MHSHPRLWKISLAGVLALRHERRATLVDLRPPSLFKARHIKGAVALYQDEECSMLGVNLDEIRGRNQTVIVYGVRGHDVTALIEHLGNPVDLPRFFDGGIDEWLSSGLETEAGE